MISWERFMDIFALRRQGFSLRDISDKLGIHRNTVTKYINQGQPPKYNKVKRKESILTPYLLLIDEWLAQDNYRASWIYHQIKNLGYGGWLRHSQKTCVQCQRALSAQSFHSL